MATVAFNGHPAFVLPKQHEWSFDISNDDFEDRRNNNADEDEDDLIRTAPTITIDDHFKGITVLRSFKDEAEHKAELVSSLKLETIRIADSLSCVAISGLGGHAFGSFKERGGSHMWLRDSLPIDIPGTRIIIYGYDTQLHGSHTFQDLEALATSLRVHLLGLSTQRSSDAEPHTKPLVFVAHSLGGLLVKQAIIQMKPDQNSQALLNSIYGGVFLGVPNQGMDISSLVPMVRGQPNEDLLRSLGKESQILRNQCREFPKAFGYQDSEIVCFYETKMSPVAVHVSP
jgi:hypothetical protein